MVGEWRSRRNAKNSYAMKRIPNMFISENKFMGKIERESAREKIAL